MRCWKPFLFLILQTLPLLCFSPEALASSLYSQGCEISQWWALTWLSSPNVPGVCWAISIVKSESSPPRCLQSIKVATAAVQVVHCTEVPHWGGKWQLNQTWISLTELCAFAWSCVSLEGAGIFFLACLFLCSACCRPVHLPRTGDLEADGDPPLPFLSSFFVTHFPDIAYPRLSLQNHSFSGWSTAPQISYWFAWS